MATPERIEKIDSKYQSSKENLLEKKKSEIE
jgi:hypothetical protein